MHSQFSTLQPAGLLARILAEPTDRAAVTMVVTGHHDRGLQPSREIPEPRERSAAVVHEQDEIDEQALLLVGLGDGNFVEVDPVRLTIGGGRAEVEVVGADRRCAVALLSGPGGVPLPHVDHRPREIVRERRRVPAERAHATERDGRIRGRTVGARVQRRDCNGPTQRVSIGGAPELNRVAHDPGAGRCGGVDFEVSVRQGRPCVTESEQCGQLLVRTHGQKVASGIHPVGEHGDLRWRERHRQLGKDDDVVAGKDGSVDRPDLGNVEQVQSLSAQDFRVVSTERVL